MSVTGHCNRCGKALPDRETDSSCPSCLLGWGLEDESPLPIEGEGAPPPGSTGRLVRVGDYELLQEIARGGMGVVYRARQVSLNRTVAVKMILAGQFAGPDSVQRFRAEAASAARLQHPNIVGIHEVGEHEGSQFFSMDYIEGRNLSTICREGPVPPREAARWCQAIASAIHFAHDQGILHRDLKPSNVLIDSVGNPHVTDFGLAKELGGGSDLTVSGQVLGSPNFMPPEQARGRSRELGRTGDVYSLGAILYHLLTGRPPFVAPTMAETLHAVLNSEVPSPRLLNPGTPEDLETICLKCLEKEPAGRYPTAAELAEELGRFLADEPIRARPIGRLGKARRWCRRRPAVAGLLAGLILVSLAGVAGILWQLERVRAQGAKTREQLALQNIVTGAQLMQTGDHLKALLWFANAFRADTDAAEREAAHRIRIASLLQHSPRLVQLISHDGLPIASAAWHRQSDRLATIGADDTLRIWEMPEGREVLRTRPFKAMPHAVTFSPDGARLCVALVDGTAVLVNAATGELIGRPLPHQIKAGPYGARRYPRFDESGARLVLQPETNQVQVFDVSTQGPVGPPLEHSGLVERAHFSRDGATLFTSTEGDGQHVAWDVASGRGRPIPGTGSGVRRSVHFADRHDRALVGTSIWLWPGPTNRAVLALDSTWLRFAAFSPGADRVVAPANEGVVRIFDTFTGEPIGAPLLHEREVATASFSPDGTRILTMADDNTARLWDAFSGEPLTPPLPHLTDADLFGFSQFSPSGRFFITVHPEFLIATWDLHREPEPPALLKKLRAQQAVLPFNIRSDAHIVRRPGGPIRIQGMAGTPEVSLHPISLKSLMRNAWVDETGRYTLVEGEGARIQVWDSKSGLPLTPAVPSSYTADEKRATVLSLPTLDWPVEDLIAAAELLSGNHLDASGGWTPLTGDELLDRWQRLRPKLPELFRERNTGANAELPGGPSRSSLSAPGPDATLDWHSKEAAAAAGVLDWRAAVFHLERFAAEHPTNTAAAGDLSYAKGCLDRLEALAGGPSSGPGLTPPRDPRADPRCIDLSQHYNASLDATVHLGREPGAFHAGQQQLGGVRFDVRGVVALFGAGPRDAGIKRPEEARNIVIERRCASIHLLDHADLATDAHGSTIATLTVRYEDGTFTAVPLRLGIEVSSDWMLEPFEPEGAKLAWVGISRQGVVARPVKRLCRYTWRNPNPERAVAALDLVSAKATAGYCLFGVTVD